MKLNKFLWSLSALAALGLASCSSDKLADEPNPNVPTNGEPVYMNISLRSSDFGRATAADYEDGSPAEQKINSIKFYFYDENHKFLTMATDNDITRVAETTRPEVEAVAYNTEHKLVLSNLPGTTYPRWVVTVVNADYTATPNEDITVIRDKVLNAPKGATYFYMSTSSNFGYTDNDYYWATPVTDNNFYKGAHADAPSSHKPVDIYLERLAAKVVVTTTMTAADDMDTGVTDNYYKITTNVKGNAESAVYVKILGWGLNGLAKDNYLMKNLKDSWATIDPFTDWATHVTDGFFQRNYWAYSTVYNIDVDKTDKTDWQTAAYPQAAKDYANNDYEVTNNATGGYVFDNDNYNIKYVNANSLTTALDTPIYCMENTNQPGLVNELNLTPLTIALVHAELCGSNGQSLGDMVRYHGVLYPEADFITLAVDYVKPNYWLLDDANSKYVQIKNTDCELNNLYDGEVNVKVKDTWGASAIKFYRLKDTSIGTAVADLTAADFDVIQNTGEDADRAYVVAQLNTELRAFNENSTAISFKGGKTYYPIYIKHLNTTAGGEGEYGVVRNHVYKCTISQITGVGRGIYDPGEVIIAPTRENDYNLDVQINILSWRIVANDYVLE